MRRRRGPSTSAMRVAAVCIVMLGVSGTVLAQGVGVAGSSTVNGYIEFEGGGRPTERLEILVQTPTGGSRIRVLSETGGTFVVRSLRPGTYEFSVRVPRQWPYTDGSAELLVAGSSTAPTTYTVTVYLRRREVPAVVGVPGRTMATQETDAHISKEARRYYRRGVEAANAQNREEAIASFRRAIELEPAYLFALNDLGVQLTKTGAYVDAVEILKRALALAPRSFPPRLNLALALLLAGRFDEAEPEIHVASEIDASAGEAPFLTGVLERRRGNREAAVAAFQKAYDLSGVDVIHAQYELGQLYEELEQREAAARCYRIFLTFVQTGPYAERARRHLRSLDAAA